MEDRKVESIVAAILAAAVVGRRAVGEHGDPPGALAAVAEFQRVLVEMHEAKLTGPQGSLRRADS
ncbi:MAG TPA: hypothetical protein VKR31_10320 [Rhizomicrobium sp.]|nr:hypothetical protein [Rhizomicrobium sp.]